MSELDQTLIEKHEDEVFALKKQLRTQEGEWKKNKAVLEQRIEILELQNRELKEKEENLKKMNNSIFGALKDFNKENSPHDSKMVQDLEVTRQQISKEYNEYKIKSQEVFKNMDKENKELKHKMAQLENKISQVALHYEKNEAVLQQKLHSFENERKHQATIIKTFEDEKRQLQDKLFSQNELQSKLGEVRFLLEKQANEHRKEIEIIKSEHMETINNLKLLAESERTTLEIQIRKLLDNKKLDGTLFEDIKKNHEKEVVLMTREKDHLIKKCDALEQQNRKLNENLIILEESLVEQKAENEREVNQNKRLKQRIADIEAQLKKFEQTEKNLKHMLTEREYKTEEVATDLKKKIINEKRRHDQAQELAKKYKEEGEKRVNMLMQESNKKDEVIKKLKSQLKAKDEKLSKKAEDEMNKTTNPSFLNISLVNQSISGSKFNPNRSMIQEIKTTRDANASKSVSQTKLARNMTQKNLGGKDPKRESTDICEYDEDPFANENILMGLSPREITRISTERNQYNNRSVSDFLTSSVNMASDKPVTFRQNIKQKRGDKQPMLKINLAEGTSQSKELKTKNTDQSQNLPAGSFELKKKSTSFSEVYPLSHAEKISSAGSDLGKLTPIHENSRSFFNINEISEHLNLTSSMNNGVKNSLSLNPSVANLSRGFQEMLDTSHKSNISAIQPQPSDYRNTNTRITRTYSDDKVKELEERLREAEENAMSYALAKERIEAEQERLVAELKQTKMGWAFSEQSKEESELALKNEIKFLIGKLLQAKNTGVNLSSSQGDLSQFTKSTALNKSTIDPQSSFANTSGFLNFSHYNPGNHFGSFSLNQCDQNSMITNINAGEKKKSDFLEKKSSKKNDKVYSEESDTPLKDKCLNIAEFDSLNDSPRRVSEFNNNENSLLMNLLSKSTNTKKSLRHVKQQD